MSIFGSPPLKASVGRSSSPILVAPPGDNFVPSAPLPGIEIAPNGQPIVVYRSRGLSDKGIYDVGGVGMDASGTWWTSTLWGKTVHFDPDESNLLDTIARVVQKYILPIIAGALGAYVGGPAGFAAALALTAWNSLAQGSSVSGALDETLKQTPGIVNHVTIKSTYDAIVNRGLSVADIQKLRDEIPKDVNSQKAFDTGVILGKSQQTQKILIENLEDHMPGDAAMQFTNAIKQGALIQDFVGARFGAAGLKKLDQMSMEAATKAAAIGTGTTTTAPPGGGAGSGSSSGPGVGTFVVVGAGGYALYKLWPKIMHRFSRPGQR